MFFPLLHVKWFIENKSTTPAPIMEFSLHNPAIITWLIIVSLLVLIAFFLEKKVAEPKASFLKKAEKLKPILIHIFQITVGISLLFASYRGAILQPHYKAELSAPLFHLLEMAAGILLIANRLVPLASILLLITYLGTFYYFTVFEAIDYINLVGISVFLYLSTTKNKKVKKYQYAALPILRISTGLALFILAFSEKLLFPYKAYEFLEKFNLNFMQQIGFSNFNNEFFTLSAGAMEAAFGLILMFGFITRINIIVLTIFFLASNLYFFAQWHFDEGIVEFMGHLPIVGTVILLIAFGSGRLLEAKKD